MKQIISSLLELLLPSSCNACGKSLVRGESVLCLDCLISLNRTYNHLEKDNELLQKLSLHYPVSNIACFLHYRKDSIASKLIYLFKYHENVSLGKYLTKLFCDDLENINWINSIDYIIPLPLHPIKQMQRGYNQSWVIAKQISKYFKIKLVNNVVRRHRYNKSQTKIDKEKRWENVEDIFSFVKGYKNRRYKRNLSKLKDKHILLIDDIITTGASINSCIKTLSQIEGLKISVLSLAYSKAI